MRPFRGRRRAYCRPMNHVGFSGCRIRCPALAWVTIVVALISATGCSGSGDATTTIPQAVTPTPTADVPATSAVTTRHSSAQLTQAGTTRTYELYVPTNAVVTGPAPLLVVLHGGGGSGARFENVSGFDQLADQNGFVVAYPDAVRPPGGQVATWNAGHCCGSAALTRVDDVGFIRSLITSLVSSYPIDQQRVFVAGYSNGGMLAYRLACEDADQITAIAVQSSTLEFSPCSPSRPVSLLHIHGEADDHVPLAGGNGPGGRAEADFTPVLKAVGTIAAADRCASTEPAATPLAEWPNAQVQTWTGCAPGAAVELVTVAGAGHQWMPESASTMWSLLATPRPAL